MPRPSGNEDDDAGELPAPACPIHRGHSGGGKPPHPRCTLCDMMVPRRALNGRHLATAHCTRGEERKRRRLAEAEPEGEIGEGPQGIGGAAGERNDISIPGTGVDGGRRLLACGVRQPWEGTKELGEVISDTGPGGGGRSESVG